MATPNPNHSPSFGEDVLTTIAPWISPSDYTETKKAAIGASSSVSGIKGDITLLKAELAGVTLASFGYAFLKVDEKGVTWMGKQLWGWKRADAAKHFQLRMERQQKRLFKRQQDLKDALTRFTESRTNQADRRRDAQTATDARNAARRPGGHTQASLDAYYAAERNAKKAEREAKKADREAKKADKAARKVADRAQKARIKARYFAGEETNAKNLLKKNAAEATKDLNNLRTALRNAASAA
ncbi:hypothetical protein ACFYU9_12745 [Streptomyces sp. NPDC004327]|uniref:hypothetical protein n=1 Tax=unclassified Streptomyces TaxID=2593676 RepID=UPI0036A2EDC8